LEFDSAGEAPDWAATIAVQSNSPAMRARFLPSSLLAPVLALLLAAGCGRDTTALPGAEANDPDYAQGQELDRQGRPQEALAAYLRVIARRGDEAPESHLDAGILYQEVIKDPIAAIYHYRKYRELKPTGPQADLVRQRIEAALRDFARTLPGQPLAGEGGELGATVERLQKENTQLRAQLAAAGLTAATGDPKPPPPSRRPDSPNQHVAPGPAANDPTIRAAPPPPGGTSPVVRKYVVVAGDTLSVIAMKCYGNKSKWPEIQAANKDTLPTDKTPLKIGMELKIP
jgi:LysM repeat protein